MSICGIIDYSGREDNKLLLNKMSEKMQAGHSDAQECFTYAVSGKVFAGMSEISEKSKRTEKTAVYKGIKYTVVLDGELYNKPELSSDIINILGYNPFKNYCDDEMLLWTYILHGGGVASYLNGAFAFAIYSESVYPNQNYAPRLFLARDRLGIKPLYYSETEHGEFIFASEIKGLLSHPSVMPVVDRYGFWQLFYISPVFIPGTTVYRDIMELEPGCCAFLSCRSENDGKIMKKRYWQLNAQENKASKAESYNIFNDLLKDAVKIRLSGDECAVLEEGLDFLSAVAIASNEYNKTKHILPVYNPVFENISENMLNFRSDNIIYDACISQLPISVQDILISPYSEVKEGICKAALALDYPGLPNIDSQALSFYSEIRKKHSAALFGGCFDEIFGEYIQTNNKNGMLRTFFPWIIDPYSRIELIRSDLSEICEGFNWLADKLAESKKDCCILEEDSVQMKESRLNTFIFIKFIAADILKRTYAMSMHYSLNIKMPFADYRLIEYAYNMPLEDKNRDSIYSADLLQNAVKNILPAETLRYKKRLSLKTCGSEYETAIRGLLMEKLSDKSSVLAGLLNMEKLSDLLCNKEFKDRVMPTDRIISWLYQTDFWFDEYKIVLNI